MTEPEVVETESLVSEDSSKNNEPEKKNPEAAERHPAAAGEEEESDSAERQPLTELESSGNRDEASESEGEPASENKMETFEIEQHDGEEPNILQQISEDVDDLDEEAQGLLAESPPAKPVGQTYCFCFGPVEKLGNCTVFLPGAFARSAWGIMGPHWFGPPCVMGVILSASSFFIHHGWNKVGPVTGAICLLWTIMILYLLVNSAYRDPGIVRKDQETPTKQHRWCELCKSYQPPKGAHCPDCNVCVAGFDQYV